MKYSSLRLLVFLFILHFLIDKIINFIYYSFFWSFFLFLSHLLLLAGLYLIDLISLPSSLFYFYCTRFNL